MAIETLRFPDGFIWGAATSAYQIEGACCEEGRGESIWDRFCRLPGKVRNGDTGDIACDHYHRYQDDIELMARLGLRAYRFSIAWPRILPQGKGQVNRRGLDFYSRLVDKLLEAEIEPFATLYHWDLPQALQDEGGWVNRNTVDWFQEYATVVSKALGDRVRHWVTHNEPWMVAFAGHALGIHAPGIRNLAAAIQVSHHLLLSHGRAVQVIRDICGHEAQVGIDLNLSPIHLASQSEEDREAARRFDGCLNRWFLDPLFKGSYPEDTLAWYADLAPSIRPGDMECIGTKVDFLGVNYYSRIVIQAGSRGELLQVRGIKPPDAEYTDTGWEIYPQGLYEVLKRLHDEYHVPALYVTENGAAFPDQVNDEGQVDDQRRIQFLQAHLLQAHRAIQEGVNLLGYFVWSLMDVFEWDDGYSKRFGLIYVDRRTQKRIIKKSGLWYGEVIRSSRVPLPRPG